MKGIAMAKKWHGLRKAAEECAELVVELMKQATFPNGKHTARRRSLVRSTEEELADVLAAVDYLIDRRSEERRVGKGGVSTGRHRGSPYNEKKNNIRHK